MDKLRIGEEEEEGRGPQIARFPNIESISNVEKSNDSPSDPSLVAHSTITRLPNIESTISPSKMRALSNTPQPVLGTQFTSPPNLTTTNTMTSITTSTRTSPPSVLGKSEPSQLARLPNIESTISSGKMSPRISSPRTTTSPTPTSTTTTSSSIITRQSLSSSPTTITTTKQLTRLPNVESTQIDKTELLLGFKKEQKKNSSLLSPSSSLLSPSSSPLLSPLLSPLSSPIVTPPSPVFISLPRSASQSDSEVQKANRMRESCMKEIMKTERDYIHDLQTTTDVFLFPLKAMGIITEGDLEVIFANMTDFLPLHQDLLLKLEAAVNSSPEELANVQIGAVFDSFFESLTAMKAYGLYAVHQGTSLERVEDLKKKEKFDNFLKVSQGDPRSKGQNINSYLIKPIQRLCKYPLLMRELLKHTSEEHGDHDALVRAFNKVSAVVSFVNEEKRKEEKVQRTKAIAEKFGIKDLVSENRVLQKEGKVFLKEGKSHLQDRYLFVFDDLILVMKPQSHHGDDRSANEKLLFHKTHSANLSKAKIVNIGDCEEKEIKNAFEVIFDGTSILFCTKTDPEKTQWLKTIKLCIKKFQKRRVDELKRKKEAEEKSAEQKRKETEQKVFARMETIVSAFQDRQVFPRSIDSYLKEPETEFPEKGERKKGGSLVERSNASSSLRGDPSPSSCSVPKLM